MPRISIHRLSLVALCAALAACSGAPPKRIFPPTASIQQITAQDDGQWLLSIRIQSFSNVPQTIADLSGTLRIDGLEAGTVQLSPQVSIGPQNVEVEELRMTPSAEARAKVTAALESSRSVSYTLSGTLVSSEPSKRRDDFSFDGQLWPAPGLPGVLR
ncbi:MAG: hypothetical protein KDI69_07510 [Xanthomonadales bacterium]|nr:hypothetical protein [Xanthomonadales bacterium]